MVGAAVEQRRRRRQVIEVGHRAIQRERAGHVFAERAGDAQEELLRCFDRLARARVAQQITVVQRAQAEVIEVRVERRVDRIVELARVGLHELEQSIVDQAQLMEQLGATNTLRLLQVGEGGAAEGLGEL